MRLACDVASDGLTGINKVFWRIKLVKQSQGAIVNFKIIFIDYNLPQMLGTEVASKIIKLCKNHQVELPKMFCCTAEDDSVQLQKSVIEAGIKRTLRKPINYGDLK